MQQSDEKENLLSNQEARPSFWQSLERKQKIALTSLAVFVLLMMVAWSVQFRRSLTEPFAYKGDDSVEIAAVDQTGGDEALKTKDTDGDGLSDWDELNNYKTSPYLEDSDSDGIKDDAEIKAGTDPNCPAGQVCAGKSAAVEVLDNGATSSPVGIESGLEEMLNQVNLDSSAVNNQGALDNILGGETDAATLREVLLNSGMDKNTLDKISDADLMKYYQEQLNKK